MSAQAPSAAEVVDRENPWPGLATFTEAQHAFFFGRDEESRELIRRVERKTLTTLFGQSGLGKSSLLQAGVFPPLRALGFIPVYIRLDHSDGAARLVEQIKRAVLAETSRYGKWSRADDNESESLWEFFHHRDQRLTAQSGEQLIPTLVFDQFEEIFTLGASGDAARERVRAFVTELAGLVESRPPPGLEAELEAGIDHSEWFDFDRSDYRVLITLREDYLPHFESLKGAMPSLMQNRMRLTRLNGAQALQAVIKPGAGLVSEEVGRAIVAFVSGRTDLTEAEVEPSLLSLVCRELNLRRQTVGAKQIDSALLAGSRETILGEFYERALADQSTFVRRWIEDNLLTDSGFRENVALERASQAFATGAKSDGVIDTLVSRRLLRIEERLDVRRVELTHDVLCAVVCASRDARRERESREAAEKQGRDIAASLEQARIRSLDARRAAVRARLVAWAAVALAVVSLFAAAWGYFTFRRARVAEAQARAAENESRHAEQMAEASRAQAEQLMVYFLFDAGNQLFATAQFKIAGRLADRTLDYYKQLPAELVTGTTELNRATAMDLAAYWVMQPGSTDAFAQHADALAYFRKSYAAGNRSVDTVIALTWCLDTESEVRRLSGDAAGSTEPAREAVAIIRPLLNRADAPLRLRVQLGSSLMSMGWRGWAVQPDFGEGEFAESIKVFEEAGVDRELTAVEAMYYVSSLKGWAFGLNATGRNPEAIAAVTRAIALDDKIIAQVPARLAEYWERATDYNALAGFLSDDGKLNEAEVAAEKCDRDYTIFMQLGGGYAHYADENRILEANLYRKKGEIRKAAEIFLAVLKEDSSTDVDLKFECGAWAHQAIGLCTDIGDRSTADQLVAISEKMVEPFAKSPAAKGGTDRWLSAWKAGIQVVATPHGTFPLEELESQCTKAFDQLEGLTSGSTYVNYKVQWLGTDVLRIGMEAALEAGDYASALKFSGRALDYLARGDWRREWRMKKLAVLEAKVARAEALAKTAHPAEARTTIDSAVVQYRSLVEQSPVDQTVRSRLANALVAQTVVGEGEPAENRRARLQEAQALLDGVGGELKQTDSLRRIQNRVTTALQISPTL